MRRFKCLFGVLSATLLLGSMVHAEKLVTSDIVSVDRIPGEAKFIVGGYKGFLGTIVLSEERAVFEKIEAPLSLDMVVVKALSGGEAVIGSARGKIYKLINGKLEFVIALSEDKDPILDMAIKGDDIWAVAPRGLIAHSGDRGQSWKTIEIDSVEKTLVLPTVKTGFYYLGASNIDADSFLINATVEGKKAQEDEDYYLNADEGTFEIVNELDESSDKKITFNYRPGPQFQAGDVSINTVSFYGESILVAGEFGSVLELNKDGVWKSLYGSISENEPNLPYWIESNIQEKDIVLVGAGGVVAKKIDGDEWKSLDLDTDNGVFDVVLTNNNRPMISGAVGTVALHDESGWKMADRTELGLLSWLKTIVDLDDDSYLITGGRGSVVLYQDGQWRKLALVEGDSK